VCVSHYTYMDNSVEMGQSPNLVSLWFMQVTYFHRISSQLRGHTQLVLMLLGILCFWLAYLLRSILWRYCLLFCLIHIINFIALICVRIICLPTFVSYEILFSLLLCKHYLLLSFEFVASNQRLTVKPSARGCVRLS
jgi:hypothetical protein